MIKSDQPTCFDGDVTVAVSSREDGTMLDRTLGERHEPLVVENRRKFCESVSVSYESCVYQIIEYGDRSYDQIVEINAPNISGVVADALYTESQQVGLFLPIADCIGVVIIDEKRRALALVHIGRHASIDRLMTKIIDFFVQKGSQAANLKIWMPPNVGKNSYKMKYFDHVDEPDWQGFVETRSDGIYLNLAGFNKNLAIKAGVLESRIFVSLVDSATNGNYFSHSQGEANGRFAVVAMLQ